MDELSPDHQAQKEKEKEIDALVVDFAENHPSLSASQAKKLIGTFVTVTPPLKPPLSFSWIVLAKAAL